MKEGRRAVAARTRSIRIAGAVLTCMALSCVNQPPPERVSFVVFLSDDQAWNGTSVRSLEARPGSASDYFETPALEEFASQGMRFSSAYSAAPNCSPTRASILTGKSPAQLQMTDLVSQFARRRQSLERPLVSPEVRDGLATSERTVAELLHAADASYATAHFGKWHLAAGGPGEHGFDVHDGETENRDGQVPAPDPKRIFSITESAEGFLDARAHDGRPFYLQISHYANHLRHYARDESLARYEAKPPGTRHRDPLLAAMTDDLDVGFARVLARLDELGLADRTYVFFLSDNGAPLHGGSHTNAPLRGGKSTLWEGGVRVPWIVRGPGVTPGAQSDEPIITWDLLPTVLDLAGIDGPLPDGVEGASLRGLLNGGAIVRRPAGLQFHLPHYFPAKGTTPVSALLLGRYKLLHFWEDGHDELYDLETDLEEANDLAVKQPELVEDLRKRLEERLAAVGAGLPAVRAQAERASAR